MTRQRAQRTLAIALAVAFVYFVFGKIGLRLAFVNASTTAFWPPTGIALASLLILGPPAALGVLLGAFLVNVTTAGSVVASLGIATGNMLEAVIGAALVRRFARGIHVFEQTRDILKFAVLAGTIGTAVSATVGLASLYLSGLAAPSNLGAVWLTWWLGDAAGALIVTPMLVLWSLEPRVRWTPRKWAEAGVMIAAVALSGLVVFGGVNPWQNKNYPLAFLFFPLMIWPTFRFGRREAATLTVLLSLLALPGTLSGYGPFVRANPNESVLILQAFLAVISMTVLVVAAAVGERQRISSGIRALNEELEGRVVERTQQLSESLRELEESETRLREAQQLARIGSWEWDIARNTVWWSDELYVIYGVDRDSFGASYEAFLERVHDDDRERVNLEVSAAGRECRSFRFEHRIVRSNGEIRTVYAEGRTILGPDRRPARMVGTGQDITERKLAEDQHRRLVEEQAARSEAEQANRLKDEFLATLSHELRTPLNSIAGWTELLRTGQLDQATTSRAIETIRRNVQIQSRLITDLLDLSRMDSGRFELRQEPVVLADVIEGALDTLGPAAHDKGVALRAELDRGLEPVVGDASRLEQVVWNLVANAIEFTPEGGEVTIRLDAWNSFARIRIEDTGPGVDPEFLPHVFDRYRQGRSGPRKTRGLGLGLAIVKHLVEWHGGGVQAANRPGGGAAFTVTLPRAPASVARDAAVAAPATLAKQAGRLDGLRILIVDDEASSREAVGLLLERCGASVREASSCAEALAAIAGDCPDVLVSDIEMPVENGYDLIRKLRALAEDRGGGLPAVALTAYAGPQDADKAMRAGYHAHLMKPVQIERLVEVVEWLAQSRAVRPRA